ncbi:hemolysin activation/secretion protein [Caulobacter ginsengisoli]|uniref:Hemolysin activation/secretion protein n=1 Tax=Caulobacter ginsengisoli TaxID=400775 RepID=A0ABU0IQS6_9CAUL|nr:ShlB/FhaC/HecB family hemolysin secretion/activation protein [Caulobacter ginsengisoli]MDQ0464363.1 hemolysin activation/secretion protein [Caulobacter ginsengisoli]
MKSILLLTAALAALSGPGLALAQTAPSKAVSPDRLDQGRPAPRPTPRAARPRRVRPAAPAIQPFVLTAVTVEGSTLTQAQLDAALQPFIGRTLDQAGLQALSDAVADAQEAADIALYTVLVPSQDFAGGQLRVVVVQGFVSQVVFAGDGGRPLGLATAYGQKIVDDKPLRRSVLQRQLSLMRDIPGLQPDVELQPGNDQGAVDLTVKSRFRPFQLAVGINTRGTAFLGRTQVQVDGFANSLWRSGDQARLSLAAPTDTERFQFVGAGYSTPLGADGLTLRLDATWLKTRPKGTSIEGRAGSLGVQLTYPIVRSFDRDIYASVGVDGLNSDNAFLGLALSSDRIRAVRGSLAFNASGTDSLVFASLSASQGIDGLGARVADRRISRPDFRKLNLKAGYNQGLGKTLIVRFAAAGQYASDPLPPSEQFSLGGEEFGRGYEADFVVGDRGYAGSVELAWRPANPPPAFEGSEAYLFTDGGSARYRSRLGLPSQSFDLASAGGGVRLLVRRRTLLQVEAVRGLSNPIPGRDRESWRGVVALRTVF